MLRRTIFILVAAAVFMVPNIAFAALPQLVQCGQPTPCTPCDVFASVKNVIDFGMTGVAAPVATLFFVYAGLLTVLYGAIPKTIEQAKTIATNTAIGLFIVFFAWLAVTSLMKQLPITHSASDTWFEFTCPAFAAQVTAVGGTAYAPDLVSKPEPQVALPAGVNANLCQLPSELGPVLAQRYKVPPQATNAPALEAMLTCIFNQPTPTPYPSPYPPNTYPPDLRKLMGIPAGGDWHPYFATFSSPNKNDYTYEISNPLCNYTRGAPVCGLSCQHASGSCHYGGKTGNQGAEAADFNAAQPQYSDLMLFAELERIYKIARTTCKINAVIYEAARPHVHVSTQECDSDKAGAYRGQ